MLVFCVGRRAALIPGSAPSLERGSWPLVPDVAAGGQSSSLMDCLCCISHMNTLNTYCLFFDNKIVNKTIETLSIF